MTFLSLVAVTSCAGVTGVVKTGPDTYMVANHGTMGWSSGPAQKARAIQTAGAHCSTLGKQLEIISEAETPGGFGQIASAEVHFKCVAK